MFCDFPPVGVRSARAGPNVKCKKVAENHPRYRGNIFFHFGPPSTGKLRFSVFGPGPGFIQVPTAVLGQNGPKSLYFAFSRLWGSGRSNRKKLTDNHLGWRVTFFSRFEIPSIGKLRFSVFGLGPEFLRVPAAQNGPNPQ